LIRLRAQRADISADIRDRMSVAAALGYDRKALNAVIRDLEADAGSRLDFEALWAVYRRAAGVTGPVMEGVLPRIAPRKATVIEAPRPSKVPALRRMESMIDQIGQSQVAALPSGGER